VITRGQRVNSAARAGEEVATLDGSLRDIRLAKGGMPTERMSMREIKEVLRQKGLGRSHRQIAESLKISAGAVGETMRRARAAGLTEFAAVESMPPSELEARLYPSTAAVKRPLPDFAWVHRERRRPGVTLELLHLEYSEGNTGGYGYTQFCEYYRQWLGRRGLSMRQVHVAGEKTFVDYSGKKPCIWDPKTGEAIEVELFVAVLGASNLTFAEATRTQRGPDWIGLDPVFVDTPAQENGA
jgi:transposase